METFLHVLLTVSLAHKIAFKSHSPTYHVYKS